MDETTSPASRPKTLLQGAGEPVPNEELMRLCLLQLARYTQWLQGEPAGEELQPKARRPKSSESEGAASTGHQTCGARLRDGSLCQRAPVEGRRRCRSHGCAPRTGAPKGNRNALKHGCFTAAEMARKRRINDFIRECNATLTQIDAAMKDEGTNST